MTDKQRAEALIAALIKAEQKARAAFRGTVALVTRHYAAKDGDPKAIVMAAAGEMQAQAARTIDDIHAQAREIGFQSAANDLEAIATKLGDGPKLARKSPPSADDRARSERYAASYALAWMGEALAATQGAGARAAMNVANANRLFHANAIATSETSRTISAERRNVFLDSARRARGNWVAMVYRKWNATLDERTCPECSAMDGVTILAVDSFPSGSEPGDVHPGCRCIDEMILHPIRLGNA